MVVEVSEEREALWAKVVKSIHRLASNWWDTKSGTRAPWEPVEINCKTANQIWHTQNSDKGITVVQGLGMYGWERSLKDVYPRLFGLSTLKEGMVADFHKMGKVMHGFCILKGQ